VRLSVVYGVSIAVHLGVAGVVWSLKKPVAKERVGVTIREVKKAPPKPQPPEPPPPVKKASAPRKVATAAARPAPAPARAAAPAAAAAAPVADFGLMMASGGDGPALAAASHAVDRPAPKKEEARPPRPKLLGAATPDEDEGCPDAPVKPKPITVLQPAYTDEARGAQIEGKVRVEITVAADGTVSNVRVIQGLGHGLDEAALEAARGSTFEAGTRCGKPIATTFTIGMRFTL
jgi:protein TonB